MDISVMLQAALREYAEDDVQMRSLESVMPGNEALINILDDFLKTRREENRARIACFWELKPSDIGRIVGGMRRVVSHW